MNKFIGLSILMLGFLFVGSVGVTMKYDASQDLYNPSVKSAFNCVKGVAEGITNTHRKFNNCALATNKPLSNFERSIISRYLYALSKTQLEGLSNAILDKTISVDVVNKTNVILSVLDQVEHISQPCSFNQDQNYDFCLKNRQYRR